MVTRFLKLSVVLASTFVASQAVAQEMDSTDIRVTVTQLQGQVAELTDAITILSGNLSETLVQVSRNRESVAKLANDLKSETTRQAGLLSALKGEVEASGLRVAELTATQAQLTKERLTHALPPAATTSGRFAVANKMDTSQRIRVNNQEYEIPAGQRIEIPVSAGSVTTQITGEEMKTWTVAAPSYSYSISIAPGYANVAEGLASRR